MLLRYSTTVTRHVLPEARAACPKVSAGQRHNGALWAEDSRSLFGASIILQQPLASISRWESADTEPLKPGICIDMPPMPFQGRVVPFIQTFTIDISGLDIEIGTLARSKDLRLSHQPGG